jgi:hypothetical protein
MLYASQNQFNVLLPSGIGNYSPVTVQLAGPLGSVDFPNIFAVTLKPSVFMISGTEYAVAVNADGTLNSKDAPASPGSIVSIWATGYGDSPYLTNPILINWNLSQVLFNAPGVLQVSFQIPTTLYSYTVAEPQIFKLQIGDAVSPQFQIWVH